MVSFLNGVSTGYLWLSPSHVAYCALMSHTPGPPRILKSVRFVRWILLVSPGVNVCDIGQSVRFIGNMKPFWGGSKMFSSGIWTLAPI